MYLKILIVALLVVLAACSDQNEQAEHTVGESTDSKGTQENTINQILPPAYIITEISFNQGDSVTTLLKPFGITATNIYSLRRSLLDKVDINKLNVGTRLEIHQQSDATTIKFAMEYGKLLTATLHQQQWTVTETPIELTYKSIKQDVVIIRSIYQDAIKVGVPNNIANEVIFTLSHFLNLKRDIRKNDTLTVNYQQAKVSTHPKLFDRMHAPQKIMAIAYKRGKKTYSIYRFKDAFYFSDGRSVNSGLLKRPINGARLSSNFGKRDHPILGYTRLHEGIDFGAPTGTPILAAGDGKVIKAKFDGSFGNCIIIKHSNGYKTLYAHLNGFAEGLTLNTYVKKGQVIGFLGNTGLSGARHLHYEIHKNGRPINPLTMKQGDGQKLQGNELIEFERQVDLIRAHNLAES